MALGPSTGIAIFCMLLTYYMWIKAVKTGSIYWAAMCALAYFYMVSVPSPSSEIPLGTPGFHGVLFLCPCVQRAGTSMEVEMGWVLSSQNQWVLCEVFLMVLKNPWGVEDTLRQSRSPLVLLLGENPACDSQESQSSVFHLSSAAAQSWNSWVCVCFVSCQVSSWGGYVFLINLIPLHVLVLMLTGRFSHRIYVAYCTVYCLGTILSMQISFVGFQVGTRRVWGLGGGTWFSFLPSSLRL